MHSAGSIPCRQHQRRAACKEGGNDAAGIHVTAVCPYWVKDTEFIGIAEKGGHGFRHYPLASRSQDVVRRALRDSALNLRVSTPGLVCTLHRAAAKVTPNLLCLPLADWLSHV